MRANVDSEGNVTPNIELFNNYLSVSLEFGKIDEKTFSDICSYLGYYCSNVQGNYTIVNDIRNYFKEYNDEYVEIIDAALFDAIRGDDNSNELRGTNTLDVLYGNSGNDTIYGNNGNDLIDGGENDDLIFGGNDNDILNGDTGEDTLNGGNGNDVLTGGTGNDTISGGYGSDTYIFNLGDGEDVINNYDSSTWWSDRIVFGEGVRAEDVEVYRSGNDLVFQNRISGDRVTVQNAMSDRDGWYYIGSVEFADGTKWDAAYLQENTRHYSGSEGDDVLNGQGWGYNYNQSETFRGEAGNDTINGNDGNDTIDGGSGSDILNGGNGNDVLTGGTGNDTISGGYGSDTYIFNLGDGEDVVVEMGGTDKVIFGEDIDSEDLMFAREGNNLKISVLGQEDSITISNYYYYNNSYKVESFQTADGSMLDYTKLDLMIQAMASFEDTTGMMWEDAVQNKNEQANDIINQWWTKE